MTVSHSAHLYVKEYEVPPGSEVDWLHQWVDENGQEDNCIHNDWEEEVVGILILKGTMHVVMNEEPLVYI